MRTAEAVAMLRYKIRAIARAEPPKELIQNFIYEAMLKIASDCAPSELIRPFGAIKSKNVRILRTLEDGKVVIYPDVPNIEHEEEELMIDPPLAYAVINETAFLLTGEPIFRQLADECVGIYHKNMSKDIDFEMMEVLG